MKRMVINNRNFQLINPRKTMYSSVLYKYAGRTLKDCYCKPSIYKEEIYCDWLKWSVETDIKCFGISSYNTNQFTLQGLYEDKEGNQYILKITRGNNKAYKIK